MWTAVRHFTAGLSLIVALLSTAQAQDQPQTLRMVTVIAEPFVMKEGSRLTGFSIDLWERIAERMKVQSTYLVVPSLDDYFEALQSKKADIGAAIVYYSTERDKKFDFSYPIMEAGQQVMVRDAGDFQPPTPLRDLFSLLLSTSAATWLAVATIIVIVPAHLIWLLDRGNKDGVSPSKNYYPGIFQATTFSITALVSQVQNLPNHWLARVIGFLWMFAGVVFIALYTAQLTANLTVEKIHGDINGPSDLVDRKVATITDSLSVAHLKNLKAQIIEMPSIDEMYQALLNRKVDAVLFSAPIQQYFVSHAGLQKVKLVGPEFNRQDIGFVFPLGDPLRRRVSSELLALREDGTYQMLYEKWFGGNK